MIVIKVLVQGIIISVISVNASQCGLKDVQEDNSVIHMLLENYESCSNSRKFQ